MHPYCLTVDGFEIVPCVLKEDDCDVLSESVSGIDVLSAGTRCLLRYGWCKSLVSRLRQHPRIAALVPSDYVAAQCTYFEKSQSRNWLVPIHQDLSIPVASRVPHHELRGWSEKEEELFVQPPVELLERLVAVRVHLDPCSNDDGPLQFVPGTHSLGRVSPQAASEIRRQGPVVSCALDRGDALVMRPLALHASSKAKGSSKRRVLHVLFGPAQLPFGLQWPSVAIPACPDRGGVLSTA